MERTGFYIDGYSEIGLNTKLNAYIWRMSWRKRYGI